MGVKAFSLFDLSAEGVAFVETMRVDNGRIPLIRYHQKRVIDTLRNTGELNPESVAAYFFESVIPLRVSELSPKKTYKLRLIYHARRQDYMIQSDELPLGDHMETAWIIAYSETPVSESWFYTNHKILHTDYARLHREKLRRDVNELIVHRDDKMIEGSITNLFLIKNQCIYTPPLSDGCVAGTFRSFLMDALCIDYQIIQKPLYKAFLEDAEEVFLTNAVRGIISVKQIGQKTFPVKQTETIRQHIQQAAFRLA